jgi:hypothetical protein
MPHAWWAFIGFEHQVIVGEPDFRDVRQTRRNDLVNAVHRGRSEGVKTHPQRNGIDLVSGVATVTWTDRPEIGDSESRPGRAVMHQEGSIKIIQMGGKMGLGFESEQILLGFDKRLEWAQNGFPDKDSLAGAKSSVPVGRTCQLPYPLLSVILWCRYIPVDRVS